MSTSPHRQTSPRHTSRRDSRRDARRGRPRRGRVAVRAAVAAALGVLLSVGLAAGPALASQRVTPGSFTGYGFDQCVAPTQKAMHTWLRNSPYWAVGIYISGDSRGCRNQPNLTPEWVDRQLRHDWRLLPITMGPQASCNPRFPRYKDDHRISSDPHRTYRRARAQGHREAAKTVDAAQALGIAQGSTLWYDLEAFDIGRRRCRESALNFLSAWTTKLHKLGYKSGVYSSGASGIKALDDVRVQDPGEIAMPDQLWVADWNDQATVESRYVRPDAWDAHQRVHQYRGGHNETYGGVTINIDNNFLDVGRGSVAPREPQHCGGVEIDFDNYRPVHLGDQSDLVRAAQCLLTEQHAYDGPIDGNFDEAFGAAVKTFRADHDMSAWPNMSRRTWMVLLSQGPTPILKYGAAQAAVRRLQRTLDAAHTVNLPITGVFAQETTDAVEAYQADHDLPVTGVMTHRTWKLLRSGDR
ncbi:MAG TPA: glycoside hydrolase domain-containing protein [Nocardioidaceae bacterium]|nr:glycoside hydrolase domain-containing protein [Nocardioidaceae bacterium]